MKKSKLLILGLIGLMLAVGLIFAGCEEETCDRNCSATWVQSSYQLGNPSANRWSPHGEHCSTHYSGYSSCAVYMELQKSPISTARSDTIYCNCK